MKKNGSCAKASIRLATSLLTLVLLSSCTTQKAWQSPDMAMPDNWSDSPVSPAAQIAPDETWWKALHDPAIDALIDATLADNPTIGQALARVDEVRAGVSVNQSSQLPQVGLSSNFTRSRNQNTTSLSNSPVIDTNAASAGLNFSWELDLFGRVRGSVNAARARLDARTADARTTRLAVTAEVADAVLSTRACRYNQDVLTQDIASLDKTLNLTRKKLTEGFVAPVEEARATGSLADAHTSLALQNEQCTRDMNSLVALTGKPATTIVELLKIPLPGESATAGATPSQNAGAEAIRDMPAPPQTGLAIPALVLAAHPSVIAAERDASAAWEDIGVARAERYPKIDLSSLLARQSIAVTDQAIRFTSWALGASLSGPLFDAGRGAATVDSAVARYQFAVAGLQLALRNSAKDVENALAALTAAQVRQQSVQDALNATKVSFVATEGQWKAGSVSLFELEDARRRYATAQNNAVAVARDRGQAWIALIKATGNGVTTQTTSIESSQSEKN